jgi:5-methylcytosine-specific restriction endonuclease McrA
MIVRIILDLGDKREVEECNEMATTDQPTIYDELQDDAIAAHQIDHVVAEKHDGATTLDNLANSCVLCNLRKGSDLSSIDPESKSFAGIRLDFRFSMWL